MNPYYQDERVTLYHGDCLTETAWLAADVLVTDPPYGRAWKRGDTNKLRSWASDNHPGIANDTDSVARDTALAKWGSRPALSFGDLMLPPPAGTKQVLVFDKGTKAGFTGAVGGYRRNIEAIYLIGSGWGSGLGGRSSIVSTRVAVGCSLAKLAQHPHVKPGDVMETLIDRCPPGVIADPFAGSGSTLVAARNLGRKAVGVEIDERYCELTARRLDQQCFDFEEPA